MQNWLKRVNTYTNTKNKVPPQERMELDKLEMINMLEFQKLYKG